MKIYCMPSLQKMASNYARLQCSWHELCFRFSSSFTSKLFWGVLCCKTLKQFSFQSCSPANQLSYWRWHFGRLIGFKSSEGIWKNNDQALWIKIPNYKKIRNDLLARRCKSAAFGTIYGTSIFGQYCIVN